jgi:hypothetical protein
MRRFAACLTLLAGVLLPPVPAHAGLLLFQADLTGDQEVPPTGSPATGFGTVLLDDTAFTITVNLTFEGLTAPATAAHIHEAPFGSEGPIEFPLDLGGALGATSGSISPQTFPLLEREEDVEEFLAGEYYFNVHSGAFPDGEIRGQIGVVPEPSTLVLAGIGGLTLLGYARSRRRRTTA